MANAVDLRHKSHAIFQCNMNSAKINVKLLATIDLWLCIIRINRMYVRKSYCTPLMSLKFKEIKIERVFCACFSEFLINKNIYE